MTDTPINADEAVAIACEALRGAEDRFRAYDGYPSEAFRRQRIESAQTARRVLTDLLRKAAP